VSGLAVHKKIDGKKIGLKTLRFFIDGAHTPESIEQCLIWFEEQTRQENTKHILCFNCKSSKQYDVLITLVANFSRKKKFDHVIFVASKIRQTEDQSNVIAWPPSTSTSTTTVTSASTTIRSTDQEKYKNYWLQKEDELQLPKTNVNIFEYIDDCMEFLARTSNSDRTSEHYNVLITGSLYLVGGFLQRVEQLEKNCTETLT